MRIRLLAGLAVLVAACLVPAHVIAQTGGSTTIKAVDTSTGATTNVGDNTNHAVRVNIVAGAGSGGTAQADKSTFTYSTTLFTPAGCVYNTSVTALASGQAGAFACNSNRSMFSAMFDGAGNALTSATRGAQQALSVQIVDSGGSQITSFGGSGGTAINDNSAFTQGTTSETPASCLASTNDAAYTTATTGRSTIVQCTTKGHAVVDIGNGSAVDGSNNAKVVGTGTAGTAAGGVLTVQGVASMTPVLVTLSGTNNLSNNQAVNVAQQNGVTVASPDANGYQQTANVATTTGTGAASACNILSAASTNATNCKASAGNFYGYEIYNTTTTVYYLRLYNASSAPTCSSATGFIRTIPIPPAGTAGQVGGAVSNQGVPVNYATGIGYCLTGGSSSTDNTSAATGVFGEIRYK